MPLASGIIVLPCGAGKTLTGIAACETIRKSTIVFCPKNMTTNMWRDQFNRWSHIDSRDLYVFTSKAIPDNFAKRSSNDSVVLIVRLV